MNAAAADLAMELAEGGMSVRISENALVAGGAQAG
jgi:hypothetical protein